MRRGLIFLSILVAGCASRPPFSRVEAAERQAASGTPSKDDKEFLDFDWPLKTFHVGQVYGWRSRKRMHEGVDLGAPKGTPIFASETGTVLFSGDMHGFGHMVILDHGDNWSSVYGHMLRATVHKGDKVDKGDSIGLVGRSGRATGYHLHFEIRKGADPLDPLLFLPAKK